MIAGSAARGRLVASSEGDRVTVRCRNGTCFVNAHSAHGIGSARLVLPGKAEAGAIIFRLHLKGLEQLTLSFRDLTVGISVASHGVRAIQQSIARRTVGAERAPTPLGPSDPEWSDVARRPRRGVESGARRFDIWLAEALRTQEPFVCATEWIDFYR